MKKYNPVGGYYILIVISNFTFLNLEASLYCTCSSTFVTITRFFFFQALNLMMQKWLGGLYVNQPTGTVYPLHCV